MRTVRLLEPAKLVRIEFECGCSDGVLDVRGTGRADDRRGHVRLVQQPGERDPGRGTPSRPASSTTRSTVSASPGRP